ncbi:putative tetratricopeptide-like helical domain superfamily [Helianthus debilis subsp. tardiflorus]
MEYLLHSPKKFLLEISQIGCLLPSVYFIKVCRCFVVGWFLAWTKKLTPVSSSINKTNKEERFMFMSFFLCSKVGKYHEALGKWEAAITLMPERATLHEQKAQVLLEIGETWKSLTAATRATQLEPSWAEAWVTLGRAQLNFGEPDSAIESFDTALAIKADCVEAKEDRQTALHLVMKRKQLHTSGLSVSENRYVVGEKSKP